jgi:hypothetical protein
VKVLERLGVLGLHGDVEAGTGSNGNPFPESLAATRPLRRYWGLDAYYEAGSAQVHLVKRNLRCVHCLNPAGKTTHDHVFPKSWYPVSTAKEVHRPTAPSCGPCNSKFGKLENYVLGRLGLCLNPTKAEAAGIPAKALRAVGIGVESELSAKERETRDKLKNKLLKEALPYSQVAGKPGILPGFGPYSEIAPDAQLAVLVNAERLREVCAKIVRGLEYHLAGRYVEPPYELDVFFVEDEAAKELPLKFGEPTLYLGPGFRVQRAPAHDDPAAVLYRIRIWDAMTAHGVIMIP